MLYTWLHDTRASETVYHVTPWKLENKVKTTKLLQSYGYLASFVFCSTTRITSHALKSATQKMKAETENELLDCVVMHFLSFVA